MLEPEPLRTWPERQRGTAHPNLNESVRLNHAAFPEHYLGWGARDWVGGRHVATPNTPWLRSSAWRDAELRAGGACVVELDTALGATRA